MKKLFAFSLVLGSVIVLAACSVTRSTAATESTSSGTTTEEVTTTAHEHSWDEGVVTVEPGCETEGKKVYTCSCGETKEEAIPALGHDLVDDEAVAATCTAEGKAAGKHCTRCDYTEGGEVVPALGHTWNDGEVTTEPTCTEKGVKTYTCTVCNETETEEVDALGHDLVDDEAVAATCTEAGKEAGKHCSRCDYTEGGEAVPALGHDWQWVVDTAATYEADGVKHEECSVCHEKQNENTVIDKLVHVMTLVEEVAATCTENGKKAYYSCSECGKYFEDEEGKTEIADLASWGILPAGHKVEAVAKVEAACEVAGKDAYYKCSVCGKCFEDEEAAKEIADIESWGNTAALGHTYEKVAAVEATWKTDGNNEYYKCSVCSKVFTYDGQDYTETTLEAVTIKATGLNYGTAEAPLTVAAAITEIMKMAAKDKGLEAAYVKGYVVAYSYSAANGTYSVRISDDATVNSTKTTINCLFCESPDNMPFKLGSMVTISGTYYYTSATVIQLYGDAKAHTMMIASDETHEVKAGTAEAPLTCAEALAEAPYHAIQTAYVTGYASVISYAAATSSAAAYYTITLVDDMSNADSAKVSVRYTDAPSAPLFKVGSKVTISGVLYPSVTLTSATYYLGASTTIRSTMVASSDSAYELSFGTKEAPITVSKAAEEIPFFYVQPETVAYVTGVVTGLTYFAASTTAVEHYTLYIADSADSTDKLYITYAVFGDGIEAIETGCTITISGKLKYSSTSTSTSVYQMPGSSSECTTVEASSAKKYTANYGTAAEPLTVTQAISEIEHFSTPAETPAYITGYVVYLAYTAGTDTSKAYYTLRIAASTDEDATVIYVPYCEPTEAIEAVYEGSVVTVSGLYKYLETSTTYTKYQLYATTSARNSLVASDGKAHVANYGTADAPLSVADAVKEIEYFTANSESNGYVKGYVKSISTATANADGNYYHLYLADSMDSDVTIYVYYATAANATIGIYEGEQITVCAPYKYVATATTTSVYQLVGTLAARAFVVASTAAAHELKASTVDAPMTVAEAIAEMPYYRIVSDTASYVKGYIVKITSYTSSSKLYTVLLADSMDSTDYLYVAYAVYGGSTPATLFVGCQVVASGYMKYVPSSDSSGLGYQFYTSGTTAAKTTNAIPSCLSSEKPVENLGSVETPLTCAQAIEQSYPYVGTASSSKFTVAGYIVRIVTYSTTSSYCNLIIADDMNETNPFYLYYTSMASADAAKFVVGAYISATGVIKYAPSTSTTTPVYQLAGSSTTKLTVNSITDLTATHTAKYGTAAEPLSVSEAINEMRFNVGTESTQTMYVIGVITKITYNSTYKTYAIYLGEDENATETIYMAYGSLDAAFEEAPVVGSVVMLSGTFKYAPSATPSSNYTFVTTSSKPGAIGKDPAEA